MNGARRKAELQALPASPQQVAAEVVAAVAAGAGAVHVHVKDDAGVDTFDPARMGAVVSAVRAAAPRVPVGVTTGAWALPDPAERVAAIDSWTVLPDCASVNWHEDGAEAVAATLVRRRVGIEAGLWHADGVDAWLGSPHRNACLRVLIELPDGLDPAQTEEEAHRLLSRVRAGVSGTPADEIPVLLHGEGSSTWPALRLAVRLGLDTRIGLEDTVELPDGTTAAGNASLVDAAAAWCATGPRRLRDATRPAGPTDR